MLSMFLTEHTHCSQHGKASLRGADREYSGFSFSSHKGELGAREGRPTRRLKSTAFLWKDGRPCHEPGRHATENLMIQTVLFMQQRSLGTTKLSRFSTK